MLKLTAQAPAKVILIGEHAVNRGAAALAVSFGLHATCTIETPAALPDSSGAITLEGGGHSAAISRQAILALGRQIDEWRAAGEYGAIQELASHDFFAPAKYVLAALGDALPHSLVISFRSAIPASAGLGSGGACFAALASAAHALVHGQQADERSVTHESSATLREIAACAQRGDIIAHGGIASGLDTQTSLLGGAIRYTVAREGEPVPFGAGLALVVGNSGVFAATSEVNGRVRRWLAERPARMQLFGQIGLLARHGEAALAAGDWPELGRLMNLNQLVLERIGVSCPELERLIAAALDAGALGAKLSGSGGGGIMVALVDEATVAPVTQAITAAGGAAIVAPVGVAGTTIHV